MANSRMSPEQIAKELEAIKALREEREALEAQLNATKEDTAEYTTSNPDSKKTEKELVQEEIDKAARRVAEAGNEKTRTNYEQNQPMISKQTEDALYQSRENANKRSKEQKDKFTPSSVKQDQREKENANRVAEARRAKVYGNSKSAPVTRSTSPTENKKEENNPRPGRR